MKTIITELFDNNQAQQAEMEFKTFDEACIMASETVKLVPQIKMVIITKSE